MGVANRDLDVSEQKRTVHMSYQTLVNGITLPVFIAPYPMVIKAAEIQCVGISGAPNAQLLICRWLGTGGGGVSIVTGLASTMVIPSYGLSGPLAASLAAPGSTLLNLNTGDLLYLNIGGGTAAAATAASISVVVQALQDIKSDFGSNS